MHFYEIQYSKNFSKDGLVSLILFKIDRLREGGGVVEFTWKLYAFTCQSLAYDKYSISRS